MRLAPPSERRAASQERTRGALSASAARARIASLPLKMTSSEPRSKIGMVQSPRMDARAVPLVEFFNGSKQNMIPLFQRPYSWDEDNWKALWSDVLVAYGEDHRYKHFFGAVVTANATGSSSLPKLLIIDGQQRLTTYAIMLAALRDARFGTQLADIINDHLINKYHTGLEELKVLPTQYDRSSFRSIITDKEGIPGSRAYKAYVFFQKALDGKDDAGEVIDPERLWETLRQKLEVVSISLADTDDPYVIFESLNAKGKELSKADLIRNYVLMQFRNNGESHSDQEEVYDNLWRPMEEGLGTDLDQFLFYYLAKEGTKITKSSVYSGFKEKMSRASDANALHQEVEDLSKHSKLYRHLLMTEEDHDPVVRTCLRTFRELNQGVFNPMLLRILWARHSGEVSPEIARRLMRMIESYAVRRTMCELKTNILNRHLSAILISVKDRFDEGLVRDRFINAEGRAYFPSNSQFREGLCDTDYYKLPYLKPFLIRLEQNPDSKEPVDLTGTTVEHVMPQKMTPEWEREIGLDHDEWHERYLHKLGNLTLTGYNSELSNANFEKKRLRYAESPIGLTREIAENSEWGPVQIRTRSMKLAQRAIAVFPRD